MTELPERIERGEATEDAVREALGYRKCTARIGAVWWEDLSGNRVTLGSLLTCLTTLVDEAHRQGFTYVKVESCGGGATGFAEVSRLVGPNGDEREFYGKSRGASSSAALALCAALVRAIQEPAR